jgi:hypothetical protein
MAQSYAHRWGQIIGEIFEQFVRDMLKSIADKHHLYLDYKNPAEQEQIKADMTWQK